MHAVRCPYKALRSSQCPAFVFFDSRVCCRAICGPAAPGPFAMPVQRRLCAPVTIATLPSNTPTQNDRLSVATATSTNACRASCQDVFSGRYKWSYNDLMPRGITFDYEKAIASATQLFRKHGYSNTSLRALLKVMKIGEGSFYNTIKSKERLYLECLKHYSETVGRERIAALTSAPSVKAGVRALLRTVLDQLDDSKTPNLCLMAGSISTDVLQERELRAYVLSEIGAFLTLLTERIRAGKASGELKADLEPEIVVQIIGAFLQGLLRTALISYDRKQVERQIDVLLTSLGL